METLQVIVPNKKARALLNSLDALGIIEIKPNKDRSLAQVMADIRAQVKKPMTEEEVMSAIKAYRRSKQRHADSRKPQARR